MAEVKYRITATGLMDYMISPAHYKAFHIDKLREPSQAMYDGIAFHLAVLEPDRFEKEIYTDATVPEGFRLLDTVPELRKFLLEHGDLTNGKKDELQNAVRRIVLEKEIKDVMLGEDLEAYYEKKIRLTEKGLEKIRRMRDSALANPWVKRNYGKGQFEMSLRGEIEGVEVRGRADWILFNTDTQEYIIVDLKSCPCSRRWEFMSAIAKSKYHVQAWIYSELVRQTFQKDSVYAWVATESRLPFITEVHACDFGALEKGEDLARAALRRYKRNVELDAWPGYTDGNMQNISIPHWAFNEGDDNEQVPVPGEEGDEINPEFSVEPD